MGLGSGEWETKPLIPKWPEGLGKGLLELLLEKLLCFWFSPSGRVLGL